MLEGKSVKFKYEPLDVIPDEETKRVSRPCNDVVFGVSFLSGVVMMCVATLSQLPSLSSAWKNSSLSHDVQLYTHDDTLKALAMSFGAAVLFATVWVLFMRFCVKCAVYCTYCLVVLVELASTVGIFYMAHETKSHTPQRLLYSLGVVLSLLVLYTLYQGYKLKSRVDLCASMVKIAGLVLGSSPGMFVVAILLACLKFGFALLCTATLWVLHKSDSEHKGLLSIPLVLMGFWGLSVIANLVLVTLYGTLGRWYYNSPGGTCSSLTRGCTTSFGSVCFGSLVVASLQTSHAGCQALQKKGWIPRYLMCVIDRVFAVLEAAVESCNTFGFVQVAVNGTGFIKSSKRAMTFLKYKGLTALLSESILSRLQSLGSFAAALLCGFVAVGSCKYVLDVELSDHERTGLLAAGFTLGWFVVYALIAPIHSVSTALLVCFAESPDVLARSHPEEYNSLMESWRNVYGEEFVDKASTLAHDSDVLCQNA
jgi:hypothetical protein